jgi:hypothetical protein
MSLAEAISKLNTDIGRGGINDGTIRSQLTLFEGQAEALERDLKRSETNLKKCRTELKSARSDLERLQADAKQEKLPPEQEAILKLLGRSGGTSWISEVTTQHHADKLAAKDFVEIGTAIFRKGKSHVPVSLTEKGRAYLVKNKPT